MTSWDRLDRIVRTVAWVGSIVLVGHGAIHVLFS